MRFVLYNIRYGTGGRRYRMPWGGYLSKTSENLRKIQAFMHEVEPDIIGLIEVDAGSYRSGRLNQAQQIADSLGHYHSYQCKYAERDYFSRNLPLLNQQGNAFITRDTIHNERFHYFERGMKRLVIELELENLQIYLVHLALSFHVRQQQLKELLNLIENSHKPLIVAGDFNTLSGEKEIHQFLDSSGLINASSINQPTYPSWRPRWHLDFILHSPEISSLEFQIPSVQFSDHLPLVWDFEVTTATKQRFNRFAG